MSYVTNATISVLTNTNLIMNIVKMVEVRIEDQKVFLPSSFDGSESDAEIALILYSTSVKLPGMDKEISARWHIMDLETNFYLEHIAEIYMNSLI